ncbi:MAG TPA: hemolysin family protein [Nocardioidaceae bacterium]
MTGELLLLVLAVALVAANGLFVAAEFSFISADRATVEREAESGTRGAGSLLAALKSLSTQLSGAQLGITATSLLVGLIAEPSLAALLRGPLTAVGVPDDAVRGLSFTLALAVATGFQMVFGELVPKNWAIAESLRVGRVVAGPQRLFTKVTGPAIRVLNGSANQILRLLGIEPTEELASARSPHELASLVRRSADEGKLDPTTASYLSRSVVMADRNTADVMTARPQVHFLEAERPVADVLSEVALTGKGRFPVLGESVDEVVGFVHFKHALAVPVGERGSRRVADVMVEPREVPTSMQLEALLATLREPGLQMAVVVDEYGGTAGVVTLEDVIEEVVGEIEDEQDPEERRHEQEPDGSWRLSGLLRPDEAAEAIGVMLPEHDESDTLAGLLVEEIGRMPERGDCVVVEAEDRTETDEDGVPVRLHVELSVVSLDGRRVDVVRLRRLEEYDEEGGSDE